MRKDLLSGLVAVVAFTLLFGVAYPVVVTGISQLAFGDKADGDRSLIGTAPRLKDKQPDPAYFVPRPSATDYSPNATFFSNRAPNSAAAMIFYRDGLKAYVAMNAAANPGLEAKDVPPDAVETSASGVDPHISVRNAEIQAARVAAVRSLPVERVRQLVEEHTDGRFLGLIGEPGVSYAALNAALDSETR